MIRCGITCNNAIRLRFSNGQVTAEAVDTIFNNVGIKWANDIYGVKNVRYLSNTCIGELCAYIENGDIQKLILGTTHDYKILAENVTNGLNFMSYVTNTLHDMIMFDKDRYIYISDGEVYYSTDKLSNQDYLHTSKFINFFKHDDYIIMTKDNHTNNDNFITIMKLNHLGNTISEVPYNKLRDLFNKIRSMKYSPLTTVNENLMYVEDYQNTGFSFIIDFDNNFDIRYINDKENTNKIKFIQYCNGITFRLQFTDKHTAIALPKLPIKNNWVSTTYSNGRYLAINESDFNVYYSDNGINWSRGVEYGEMQMSNIIAAGDVVLLYNKESIYTICYISYDRGNRWSILDAF